jgi:polyferredoxin
MTPEHGRFGLELFPPGSSPRHRRRRLIFAALWLLIAASLIWPVFPFLAAHLPWLFGLPPALAALALALVAILALQLWLFFGEEERQP